MPTCPTCEKRFDKDATSCPDDGAVLLPDDMFAKMDHALAAGTLVGEYKVEEKLGEGGFGSVYKAIHPLIGKAAAIKVLNRQFSSNPQMVSRFIAEARAVNQIRHKNIIDVFSFGTLPDGRQYYVMELLTGATFDALIKSRGRLAPAEAIPILRGVARALDAAHKAGIVHRDLKPENVFLLQDEDGIVTPKLLDFGIAKLAPEAGQTHKTKTGTAMGTPYYMSPEQARGVSVDFRTDIYSFGVMTYEALAGEVPFRGEAAMDILLKHLTAPVPLLEAVDPALAPGSLAIVRMMAKEPHQRFESVGAAVEALAQALGVASVAHPSLGPLVSGAPATGSGPTLDLAAAQPSTKREGNAHTPDSYAKTTPIGEPAVAHPGETFLGAETDVLSQGPAPARRKTSLVFVVGAVALIGGVGLAAALMPHRSDEGNAGSSVTQTARATAAPASAPSSAGTTPLAVDSAKAASTTSSTASAPPALVKVSVRIETTPPKAQVFSGEELLGAAPGPFEIEKGKALTLTVRASGFTPATVDVSGADDETKTVTLHKTAPTGPNGTATSKISRDLESPF
jgi:serine/threonine-protein kinase